MIRTPFVVKCILEASIDETRYVLSIFLLQEGINSLYSCYILTNNPIGDDNTQ